METLIKVEELENQQEKLKVNCKIINSLLLKIFFVCKTYIFAESTLRERVSPSSSTAEGEQPGEAEASAD